MHDIRSLENTYSFTYSVSKVNYFFDLIFYLHVVFSWLLLNHLLLEPKLFVTCQRSEVSLRPITGSDPYKLTMKIAVSSLIKQSCFGTGKIPMLDILIYLIFFKKVNKKSSKHPKI